VGLFKCFKTFLISLVKYRGGSFSSLQGLGPLDLLQVYTNCLNDLICGVPKSHFP
jgi:hypothetical protein